MTTICGLIEASSQRLLIKQLFPNVEPVFTNKISPFFILISGDSSNFSCVIYVLFSPIINRLSIILVGLKVNIPPSSLVIISFCGEHLLQEVFLDLLQLVNLTLMKGDEVVEVTKEISNFMHFFFLRHICNLLI